MPLELRDCGPISRVGLGTWATFGDGVDAATARAVVSAALDAGITHIDTAPSYAGGTAEEWLGQFLAGRTDVVISTKAYFDTNGNPVGLGRAALFQSVEGSLKRLRRDCIDLLYCHRADPDTPLEETLAALAELREQGKIKAWGISRWPAELVLRAAALAGTLGLPPPACAQEPYNRLHPAPAAALKARAAIRAGADHRLLRPGARHADRQIPRRNAGRLAGGAQPRLPAGLERRRGPGGPDQAPARPGQAGRRFCRIPGDRGRLAFRAVCGNSDRRFVPRTGCGHRQGHGAGRCVDGSGGRYLW